MVPAAAPAPQPAAALVGSSVSVPTSSTKTTVEVRGPSLMAAGLARVGERLAQLGRTRIRTVQETVIQNPASQSYGGMATIATTGVTPIAPPPSLAPPAVPPAPPVAPPPSEQSSPTPTPTPIPSLQGPSSQREHSLLKHFGGRR
jgi:hypothetical protein